MKMLQNALINVNIYQKMRSSISTQKYDTRSIYLISQASISSTNKAPYNLILGGITAFVIELKRVQFILDLHKDVFNHYKPTIWFIETIWRIVR